MYDPKLGRFLSPDILVQDAGNTQNYNRYSYCVNNPLAYTDPSGYEQLPDGYLGDNGDGRHGTPFNFNVSLPVNYNGGNIWGGGMGNSGFEGMYGTWASSFENYNTSGQRARSTGSMLSNIRNFFTNFLNNVLNPIRGANGVSGEPGTGVDPDPDKGGFMSSFDGMVQFMYGKSDAKNRTSDARTGGVELAAFIYQKFDGDGNVIDTKFFVQPWYANDETHSSNYPSFMIPELQDLIDNDYYLMTQVHTQNSKVGFNQCDGPSINDQNYLNTPYVSGYAYPLAEIFVINKWAVYHLTKGSNYDYDGDCLIGITPIHNGSIYTWKYKYK